MKNPKPSKDTSEPKGASSLFDKIRVKVVSESFRGKSRVDRHRVVNHLLKTELESGVHALAIEAKAPGERPKSK